MEEKRLKLQSYKIRVIYKAERRRLLPYGEDLIIYAKKKFLYALYVH